MNEINIRKLQASDRNQMLILQREFVDYNLKYLHKDGLEDLIDYDDINADVIEEFDSYIEEGEIGFVAELNDKIVGYITGTIEIKKNRKYKTRGVIHDFFVTESQRQKGIGDSLYNRIVDEFKAKKCELITLNALSNNEKSIKLYKKLGFSVFKLGFIRKI